MIPNLFGNVEDGAAIKFTGGAELTSADCLISAQLGEVVILVGKAEIQSMAYKEVDGKLIRTITAKVGRLLALDEPATTKLYELALSLEQESLRRAGQVVQLSISPEASHEPDAL